MQIVAMNAPNLRFHSIPEDAQRPPNLICTILSGCLLHDESPYNGSFLRQADYSTLPDMPTIKIVKDRN